VTRLEELAANLHEVRERIARAAVAAGREPWEVTLVAVTKTWPANDVRLLAELGVTDVGENRDQEAAPKHAQCRDLPVRWHFIGRLQRNKAHSVASYADVVESVDRLELVAALDRHAGAAGRRLEVLVQVALDPSPGRGGAPEGQVPRLCEAVVASEALELGGVMAVAPLGQDPEAAFAQLERVAAAVSAAHPRATVLSAGMSGDLEPAIRHGATHVRIGTALLGPRAVPVG